MGGWNPGTLPTESPSTDDIRVLHVDDQPDFLTLARAMLEREDDAFTITTASTTEDAHAILDDGGIDCVVSDFDMPNTDGLAFLRDVRETHPDLPFVLFTGKGSEEIASRAINEGVTDYVQKGGGREQYEVLANRVRNAVDQQRAHDALEASRAQLASFIEQSPMGIIEWDAERRVVRMNATAESILGYTADELRGSTWRAIVPSHERDALDEVAATLRAPGATAHSINENVTSDGELVVCEWYNRVVTNDAGESVGVFSQFQDVSEREEYRRRLGTLIDNLPGIVYRCRNERAWPFDYLAGVCEALTGYPTDAFVDGDIEWGDDVIVEADQDRAWATVQDALDDQTAFELTYEIQTRTGDRRTLWERGQGVYDHEGDLLAIEGFITDVTTFRDRTDDPR